jgi:hypothetical protein
MKKTSKMTQTKDHFVIFTLENNIYYFLEAVRIIRDKDLFRLLVLHRGHVYTDKLYTSMKGARIGFSRKYGQKRWDKTVKPLWEAVRGEDD